MGIRKPHLYLLPPSYRRTLLSFGVSRLHDGVAATNNGPLYLPYIGTLPISWLAPSVAWCPIHVPCPHARAGHIVQATTVPITTTWDAMKGYHWQSAPKQGTWPRSAWPSAAQPVASCCSRRRHPCFVAAFGLLFPCCPSCLAVVGPPVVWNTGHTKPIFS